jgi:hypothetical protein
MFSGEFGSTPPRMRREAMPSSGGPTRASAPVVGCLLDHAARLPRRGPAFHGLRGGALAFRHGIDRSQLRAGGAGRRGERQAEQRRKMDAVI